MVYVVVVAVIVFKFQDTLIPAEKKHIQLFNCYDTYKTDI